jgi:hypothetical protein
LAAVCCALETTRKQSTQTTAESMDAFLVLSHESAACAKFKRTHRRGAEGAENNILDQEILRPLRPLCLCGEFASFCKLCVLCG